MEAVTSVLAIVIGPMVGISINIGIGCSRHGCHKMLAHGFIVERGDV